MKPSERSPLKDKPLRSPGQSIEEMRDELIDDKILVPGFGAFMFVFLAARDWWVAIYPQAGNPIVTSIAALIVVLWAFLKIRRSLPELRALRLARDGERAVGQFLESLREEGYRVFHDIVGEGFNLDHVIIGPAGIATIETKTHSKPSRGDARIQFDGERILVAGHEPDRDPILQAKAQAGWFRQVLRESTGRDFPVRPIVVYPGWFVEKKEGATDELWVLEPKALPSFLRNCPTVMSNEDIRLASFHLSRFVRVRESERAAAKPRFRL